MDILGRILFAAAVLVVLGVGASVPPTALFSSDSGPKFWQTVAFAEGEGRPRAFEYPAADLDPNFEFHPPALAPVDGRLASAFPVLFPMLAAVPVALGGDALLRTLPLIAAVAAAWLTGVLASSLGGGWPKGLVATLALVATPLSFYAVSFWEHSLGALMVVAGVTLVVHGSSRKGDGFWRWAAFGALIGMGAWVRTELLFLAPVLALPVFDGGGLRAFRKVVAAGVSLVAGAAFVSLLQFIALGVWLPLHVSYHLHSSFKQIHFAASRWDAILAFVTPHWTCGFATALWFAAIIAALLPGTRRGAAGLWLGIAAIAACLVSAFVAPAILWAGGVRPTDAFPHATPTAAWILLSALPVVLWGAERSSRLDRRRFLMVVTAAWMMVAVFLARPVLAINWGNRFLLPSVLLLTALMFSYPAGERTRRFVRRAALVAAVIAALAVQALGVVLFRHGSLVHYRLNSEVQAFSDPGEPVIADTFLVPLVAGRSWWERRYMFCTGSVGLARLMDSFERNGVERWTYATVDRMPGRRLRIGPEVEGHLGSNWRRSEEVVRDVGSRRLRLWRFQRVESRGRGM